jgi:hypothetical protein
LSAVVKVRVIEGSAAVSLDGMAPRESVVSGPESVKGAETFMVSV